MKTFPVTITETLEITVEIEAETRAEAERIAEANWKNADYVLDADHFRDVHFYPKGCSAGALETNVNAEQQVSYSALCCLSKH